MLNALKNQDNSSYTLNGAKTNRSSENHCLDLFFKAGASRGLKQQKIESAVTLALAEDESTAMKIIFYSRDIRGGLGERRFFRTAIRAAADFAPDAVIRNIRFIPEYGRFDDLLALLGTQCEKEALNIISAQLKDDLKALESGGKVSLLGKWLPSVNASSGTTRSYAKRVAGYLGLSLAEYRKTLSALRNKISIIENDLRNKDYSFDYSTQPSGAMFKYKKAFIRNDKIRYMSYIDDVISGKSKLNAKTLYPYQITRSCYDYASNKKLLSANDKRALDASWRSLPDFGKNGGNENAIAVVDTSGSMTCSVRSVRPIDVSLSLGIYFAEHIRGAFAGHFITFSHSPRLIKVKGKDIVQKVKYCLQFTEYANTNIEAVFDLILKAAVDNNIPKEEMISKIYLISDMEFDSCVYGGNDMSLFEAMSEKYSKYGYKLPDIIFWNVNSFNDNVPIRETDTGAALVSGFTPMLFDMTVSGELSPLNLMHIIIFCDRYNPIF